MFGMSFSEILIIAVVAILVLGPDKLPEAMVQIAKFFKMFKKGINDAKSTFDQEMKIAELKEDARKYKESITQTTQSVRKKLTFEELDELKKGVNEVTGGLNDAVSDIKKSVDTIKNPTNAIKDAVLGENADENSDTKPQKEA
ncbi:MULTISPECIES: Sec-independent protein translocase protein TatB [Campylobacter]|jgi:twin arginine-targeting protein translocase tatB|uniref:Sec-independent protein translocase protein TatB homolog n=1 Tax=Campylobacter curvus (strain 525.92) TaxID=360105 RepID=A7GXR5_CAMC5|nr:MULTISPECIES: Sec-independent protein translocase protein TatB [Campylobacter]EAU00684.1 twin arginine translocation system, TatB family protein [Campylobacter curvus 525.92]EJP75374.1 twin arginine-targeting protein translocase TatB [Campylobacter sp. FOBRC14]MBN7287680.1 Sec-independent protein translocase subunit TatB [Campylobacter curvus]MDU6826448.1 Sec-independent protein translocase protein TatB [Campylobacter sp.]QKF61019.1 twin arginine translocation system, TatB protein [Campylob